MPRGVAPPREATGGGRLPGLDGLRCLAILPVVFHHTTFRPMEGALGRGPLGVDLFFATSGFLITTLLLRERARTGRVALGAFWMRRALRIFPLYYLVLALHVAWALALPKQSGMRASFFEGLPFYATYTGNWFPPTTPGPQPFAFSWSLAVEEQFYLAWPPLLALARRRVTAGALLGALVAVDQLAEAGLIPLPPLALRIVTSASTPIALGALLAVLLDEPRARAAIAPILGSPLAGVTLWALFVLAFAAPLPILLVHAAFAALVARTALGGGWEERFLESRPLSFVGQVSYGVYLLHVTVLGGVKALVPAARESPGLLFALGAPLSIGAGAASFYAIERPLARLRERLRR